MRTLIWAIMVLLTGALWARADETPYQAGFLAPCPAALAEALPEACQDPPGVDRVTLHRRIAAELVDFFDRTLGPDVPTITSD